MTIRNNMNISAVVEYSMFEWVRVQGHIC